MDRSDLIGGWSLSGMELDVVELEDRLAVSFPEAPEGLESDLIPLDDGEYQIRGGQFDGALISFALDEGQAAPA